MDLFESWAGQGVVGISQLGRSQGQVDDDEWQRAVGLMARWLQSAEAWVLRKRWRLSLKEGAVKQLE